MNRAARLVTFALLTLLPFVAGAAGIAPETRWSDPSRVDLGVEFPGDGYHAEWELHRCACGDLLVRSELSAPGEVDKGETLLVQGRAVLSRGFGDRLEELGASLDAPALMMQLALRLLERVAPEGPAGVDEAVDVDLLDEINPILLESWSAMGGFHPPWTVQGRIAPAGDTRRRFDLAFEFSAGAGSETQKGRIRLKGLADFAAADFPVPETAPLEGWRLDWRDNDDPAIGAAAAAGTLQELREAISGNAP